MDSEHIGGTAGTVAGVHLSAGHTFSKTSRGAIELLAGLGVDGDIHLGATDRHQSRAGIKPTPPNLRQVHLMHAELFDELAAQGFTLQPGDLGENVTTRGVDLLGLPTGALLRLGDEALVAVTGLRNPCRQIENFQTGLLAAVVDRGEDGSVARKTGVMAVVVQGGTVRPGDPVTVAVPPRPHRPLEQV